MMTERRVRVEHEGPARRILPAVLALLFSWFYGYWLPYHLIEEPPGGLLGWDPHSHTHKSHDESADIEAFLVDTSPTENGARHQVESSHTHQHPALRLATIVSKAPFVGALLPIGCFEFGELDVTKGSIPTSRDDPPKRHDHSQASARAPPSQG